MGDHRAWPMGFKTGCLSKRRFIEAVPRCQCLDVLDSLAVLGAELTCGFLLQLKEIGAS